MSAERTTPRLEIKRHSNPDRGIFVTGMPHTSDTREVDSRQILDDINSLPKYRVRKARGHSGRSKKRQR